MESSGDWNWFHYYWQLCKYFGRECYLTWKRELMTSLFVGASVFVINHDWKDFKTGLLATALTFGCLAGAHFLRAPWLIYRQTARGGPVEPSNWGGFVGLVVIVAVLTGGLQLGRVLWRVRPLGTMELTLKFPPAAVVQTRIVKVQEPCKLTAEQINPARLPQACPPGTPPPTLQDKVLAINTHLTEGDRNRFSNALAEFEESMNQGESLFGKINTEGHNLDNGRSDGTIAKNAQSNEKTLNGLAAEAWKWEKAFPVLREKWKQFETQEEYIFSENPDNLGPNALINAADSYSNYLERWDVIQNKQERPVLELLALEQIEFERFLNAFANWHQDCMRRLTEMRNSIR
ncbi:MAG: hypothetical protein WAN33_10825 [Candidatus Acidiferrales bacterium]